MEPATVTRDRAYNTELEQSETFPKHPPVRDKRFPGAYICGWRDTEGRRCGREFNFVRQWDGTEYARHNPPRGVPHPRSAR